MIRAALLSFLLTTPVAAQTPDVFLVDLWNDFSTTCMPFVSDPRAAVAQPPADRQNLSQSQSQDGAMFRRYQGGWHMGWYRMHNIMIGMKAAHVDCSVARTRSNMTFKANTLDQALRRLSAGTASLRLTGGFMPDTIVDAAARAREGGGVEPGSQSFRVFMLEGAMGGRPDIIRIEMSDQQVIFSVSATVLAGAGQ